MHWIENVFRSKTSWFEDLRRCKIFIKQLVIKPCIGKHATNLWYFMNRDYLFPLSLIAFLSNSCDKCPSFVTQLPSVSTDHHHEVFWRNGPRIWMTSTIRAHARPHLAIRLASHLKENTSARAFTFAPRWLLPRARKVYKIYVRPLKNRPWWQWNRWRRAVG